MTTLLELAREFTQKFSDAKRELGMVDFHDLEQHALELLWDRATSQPTKTAQRLTTTRRATPNRANRFRAWERGVVMTASL